MTYYDETLQTLQQQKADKVRLEAKRKVLKTQEAMLMSQLRDLERIKFKEEADVDRLSRRSLANFYYKVIGKKDGMLTKEQEEAYAAQVKYDAALHSLAAVKKDLSDLSEQLLPLRDCDRKYDETLAAKRDALLASGDPIAEQIMGLEMLCTNLESQKKEIDEAIKAGEQAMGIAQSVLESLGKAENWGKWDLIGGGLGADIAKHSHLDDAQRKIDLLQDALRRFKTELTDVRIQAQMQVQVDGFLRFADYFFDGLFADWSVLGRIQNSQSQVYSTKKQLDDAVKKLHTMKDAATREQAAAKAKRGELIRTAGLPAAQEGSV